MALFSPFSALTAGAAGAVKGYTEDLPKLYDMMGMQALGKAFQMQAGPIDQMNQGPQPPMPGQASMPAQPMMPMPGPDARGMPGPGPMMPSPQMPVGGGPAGPVPPQAPPPGASPPGGGSPMPQTSPDGMPQFDLQTLMQRIQQTNPGLPPQAMVAAITRATPLLSMQGKIELTQMRAEQRQQALDTQEGFLKLKREAQAGATPSGAPASAAQQPAQPARTAPAGDDNSVLPMNALPRSGGDPEPPQAVGGMSSSALVMQATQYLQTGKLTGFSPRDPVSRAQINAVKNYAADLAASRGMAPSEVTEMWRFAPRQAGWLMGADGRASGSLGTVVDHLDTARDLFRALNNSDAQLYNRVKNAFQQQFGVAAPTNVQAAAQIVGSEVMKAIGAAGAGTGEERKQAAQIVGDLGKSPEQAVGAIDTLQKLIAGQLRTKQRQASAIGLPPERFEKLVGKRSMEVLGSIEPAADGKATSGSGAVKVGKPADALRLEPGTRYVTPDGIEYVR